ncbi:MAG: hypothetical protein UU35_C0004G0071, partial [Candidatus Uhrbacteria bacterium GW2011_GWC2_41_11]
VLGRLKRPFEFVLGEAAEVRPCLFRLFLLFSPGLLKVKGKVSPLLFLWLGRALCGRGLLQGIVRTRGRAYAKDLFKLDLFSGRRRRYYKDILALGAPYLYTIAGYAGIVESEFGGAFIAFYYHLSPLIREFPYL